MTNTVDYLPIANGVGANVETQAQYVTDLAPSGALADGYVAGIAKSNQVNKTLRQSSMISAAVANFISQRLNASILDDGDLTSLTTNLTDAIRGVGSIGTIASAATTDIGSVLADVLTVTGAVATTSFGNSMAIGEEKTLLVVSSGWTISYNATYLKILTGFGPTTAGRLYRSQAGDVLTAICTGTSGGSNTYTVLIQRANGRAYQDNSTIGERQNFTVVPHVAAPDSAIEVFNCGSIILGLSGDTNQQGARSTVTKRLENASQTSLAGGLPNPSAGGPWTFVSLLVSGLGGLDTGTIAPNTDYWLHAVADDIEDAENYNYVLSLNPTEPNRTAFPTYVYSACCGFVSTNGSNVITQFQKVNFKTTYAGSELGGRLIASGDTSGLYISVPLVKDAGATSSIVSPQASYFYFILKVGTTANKLAAVAINSAHTDEVCYLSTGGITGFKIPFSTALDGAFVFFKSTDPDAELWCVGYDDVV